MAGKPHNETNWEDIIGMWQPSTQPMTNGTGTFRKFWNSSAHLYWASLVPGHLTNSALWWNNNLVTRKKLLNADPFPTLNKLDIPTNLIFYFFQNFNKLHRNLFKNFKTKGFLDQNNK